ncbi:hypothetical protein [Tenacibaculum xiamenense]|uniref:hypothetical protein n=1 Tax=Tenacibaculum xiamenense TaxID=1261553 RepID=UPI0038937D28
MGKISDKGINEKVVFKVLNFLNNAKSAEEIAYIERTVLGLEDQLKDYNIGEIVAQRIIDKRDSLQGFSKLSELNNIKGFGVDKFNDLINSFKELEVPKVTESKAEPLFRFASFSYINTKTQNVSKKTQEAVDNGRQKGNNFTKVREFGDQEIKTLEEAHIAALARYDINFIKNLLTKLTHLSKEYHSLKNEELKISSISYNKLIEQKIKKYEESLSDDDKKRLEVKKNQLSEILNADEKIEQKVYTPVYPSSLFPDFKFSYMAFSSIEHLAERLEEHELRYLERNNFLDLDFLLLQNKLNEKIKEKQSIAAYPELKWKKKVAIHGSIISLKNRYRNGYVVSINKQEKTFFLSLITPSKKSFITTANLLLLIDGKEYQTETVNTMESKTRQLFFKMTISNMPELKPNTFFSYEFNIELNSGEKISFKEIVSAQNEMWIGQYTYKENQNNQIEKSFNNNIRVDDLHGIMRVASVDLMLVEQELCCYVPGEVAHIENIMAREYKEKSTEYLERSESTYTQENETEIVEKNDTTSAEKHDWNKEIKRTIDNNTDFNLSGTVSYGSKDGPWYANINSDLGIAHSKSQSNTNAQSYSEEITKTASESIRNKSFEKRSTTLIKQFKEENKHGFDNRGGDQHVSGVFRWIDKIYKNRIINYGKHTLLEFMVPKPSELYVQTLVSEDTNNDLPEPPVKPDLKSWQDVTRDNYLKYINDFGVDDYEEPKDMYKYEKFESGTIDGKSEFLKLISVDRDFTYTIPTDYYLEVVRPTSSYGITGDNITGNIHAFFKVEMLHSNYNFQLLYQNLGYSIATNTYITYPIIENHLFNYDTLVNIKISGKGVSKVNHVNLDFRLKLKASVYQQWQKDTYKSIMDAYQVQLDKYNANLAAANQANGNNNDADASVYDANQYKNPGFYKEIVNTELKRLCIELLFSQSNTSIDRCENYYEIDDSCICDDGEKGLPVISKDKLAKFDHYASVVKLFEQSLLWSVMSFNLYDYHWAEKCDWANMLHNNDTPDNDFQKFLKSGMARVLVPIREGFEEPLINFITTGNVSLDPNKPNDFPFFLSIMDELKKPVGEIVGDSWNTKVPSTLTLIQGDTVFLQNQGLPCCSDVSGNNGISPSKAKLEGGKHESGEIEEEK